MKKTLFLFLALLLLTGLSCNRSADGGIFYSPDFGETWEQRIFVGQQKKRAVTITQVNVQKTVMDPNNSAVLYLATKEHGLWKSENSGQQWTALPLHTGRIFDVAVDPTQSSTLFAVRDTQIFRSFDAGQTWETVYTDSQSAFLLSVVVDWYNHQRVFASTSIGSILFSEDGGQHWRVVYQVSEPIVKLIMNHQDSRILYALELDEAIHKSSDGGLTWDNLFEVKSGETEKSIEAVREEFNAGSVDQVKRITMDPQNANILYGVTASGILTTYDGGESWKMLDTLIERDAEENKKIRSLVVQPGNSDSILFAIDRILHVTRNGGISWETIDHFPSSRRITDILIDPQNSAILYVGVEFVEEKKGFFR